MLLNDCYNANPLSMRAALQALADVAAERRIAVLGTMAELGDHNEAEHAAAGALADRLGIPWSWRLTSRATPRATPMWSKCPISTPPQTRWPTSAASAPATRCWSRAPVWLASNA